MGATPGDSSHRRRSWRLCKQSSNWATSSISCIYKKPPAPTKAPTKAPTPPTKAPTPSCQYHNGITGPFPGLKLADGSAASPTWYEPYQKHVLTSPYNETHEYPAKSGKLFTCNPASCENPPICGIPVCRGMSVKYESPCLDTRTRSKCAGNGCHAYNAETRFGQLVKSMFPSDENVQPLISGGTRDSCNLPMKKTDMMIRSFLPGIRFGYYDAPANLPGFVSNQPAFGKTGTEFWDGSWMYADQRFCNPLQFSASGKGSVTHTGLTPQAGEIHRKSGTVLQKMTICMKADCPAGSNPASCPPKKCYTSKKAICDSNPNLDPIQLELRL